MTIRTDSKLWGIVFDIYKEAFKQSTPSADFDKLRLSTEAKKPQWFMKYYLPAEEYDAIIKKHFKKNKVTEREGKKMSMELYLGCAPTSVVIDKKKKSKVSVDMVFKNKKEVKKFLDKSLEKTNSNTKKYV